MGEEASLVGMQQAGRWGAAQETPGAAGQGRPQGMADHTLRPLRASHTRPQAVARSFRGGARLAAGPAGKCLGARRPLDALHWR